MHRVLLNTKKILKTCHGALQKLEEMWDSFQQFAKVHYRNMKNWRLILKTFVLETGEYILRAQVTLPAVLNGLYIYS
jgi:hypothetical protein